MLNGKTIGVVVPCYNEESQVGLVLETMPEFVDRIIVINDKSTDSTEKIIIEYIDKDKSEKKIIASILDKIKPNRYNRANIILQNLQKDEIKYYTPSEIYNKNKETDKIILINHLDNAGKGAGISTGYKWAKDHGLDCVATMDGDGQMDPDELLSLCEPVVYENIDYVKGNRLIHRSALLVIPKIRYLGNSILSILTKLASGYWHVSDTQTGYSAMSNKALNSIIIHDIYKSYGYPNDVLVKLNIAFCTMREVEIKPVYDVGEQSKMKIYKVIPTVSWLLVKSFFKRLWTKYLFRDFHPLFLLYNFSFLTFVVSLPLGIKILGKVIEGVSANPVTILGFGFLFLTSIQFFLFAMWMDIQDNERLYK
ncbi:MAG: glycosyltransferase involved in cell wall biosynthesis [Bacteroidia bacterium]|jgi:glycosyltransferase involved in cell wall biosynthesis